MTRSFKTLFLTLAAAASIPCCQAQAATKTIKFSGILSSAENVSSDDPDVHSNYAFAVGQKFFGTATFNTSLPGNNYEYSDIFPLLSFSYSIGGVDLSDRFIGGQIYTDPNGGVDFSSGEADQGGYVSLKVDGTEYTGAYPSTSVLNGKRGFFSFLDNYAYTGGSASGEASVSVVPELSTWVSLILGLGSAGAFARYRRRRVQIAYA